MSVVDLKDQCREMTDDELADLVIGLKAKAAELREAIWSAEDTLRNRLIERQAKRLQGERYLVKSSIKRDIKWADDVLHGVRAAAAREGHLDLFNRAFPMTYSPKLREVNELLKFGGETAALIESAKAEVTEKINLEFEPL